ncbi:MAG TPA: hypothetical protein VFU68_00850, partial [Terracidiphilus sp.]|nr:hypothetical protein [Terracidiphilus sp.]
QVQPVAAAAQSTLNGQGAHNALTTPSMPVSGAHSADPFATLDASAPANPATWTHAGANTAEAGFQDPSLGWVGVRAQSVAAGAIHASVLPSSSDAAQALSGHLAGLHAYLADHHALTGTVTVARPESSASWSGSGQQPGQNHGHNQGGQGSSQGGNPQSGHFWGNSPIHSNPSAGSVHSSHPHATAPSSVTHAVRSPAMQAAAATHPIPRGGGLISVVA